MEENRKQLIEKLTKAIVEIGAFAADKKNTYQNYDYISADMVIERAGKALSEVGLIVMPSIVETEVEEVKKTDGKTEKTRYDARIVFEMTVTDGECYMVEKWVGFGSDTATPDKAIYKGITSGHKYFLMKLLQISIGNSDGEHEEGEEKVAKKLGRPAGSSKKIEALSEEAMSLAKTFGGGKNPKVMEILGKYTDKGNPNSIKDEQALTSLIADLKSPENVTALMAGKPK